MMCKEPFVFISKWHPVDLFMWGLVKYRNYSPMAVPWRGYCLLISVKCTVRHLEFTHELTWMHGCGHTQTHMHNSTSEIHTFNDVSVLTRTHLDSENQFPSHRVQFVIEKKRNQWHGNRFKVFGHHDIILILFSFSFFHTWLLNF